ncbi:hypothetical protein FG386_001384 [Cryptosporidium ryanae]|uniref:uncharacterized protein n=1 Tax=Cryptosporidium ryanae TaxID=515981 RepID=UPI00351A2A62|nr:hypothetical protein FG386_001384 [Cryptosporidium ryanae]
MNKLIEVSDEIQSYNDQENIIYNIIDNSVNRISPFSISFISFIGIIYLILGTLSILQISTVELRTINIVESNGRKIRPYFLKIFTLSVVLRLFYIMLILLLCFDPLFTATIGINKFKLFKIYDYVIDTLFLTSYSIIVCLWSSILIKSEDNTLFNAIQIPLIIGINTLMYILCGIYLIIFLRKEIVIKIEMLIHIFTGVLYSFYSYLWLYLGLELVKQINKRRDMYSELSKSFINKNLTLNSSTLNIDNYNLNKNTSNKSAGILEISTNFNMYSETTSSSSPNLSCRFFYDYMYKSTIIDLRSKIMLITLICPLSLTILGISYIINGISLVYNFINNNSQDTLSDNIYMSSYRLELDGIYLFLTEIIPSVSIIYGFWNSKNHHHHHQLDENNALTDCSNNLEYRNVFSKSIIKYTQLSLEKLFGYKGNRSKNSDLLNGVKTERYYYNIGEY